MTLGDPATWGPILVAATIYLSSENVIARLRLNSDVAANAHRESLEILESIQRELDSIGLDVVSIQTNTETPSNASDYD